MKLTRFELLFWHNDALQMQATDLLSYLLDKRSSRVRSAFFVYTSSSSQLYSENWS